MNFPGLTPADPPSGAPVFIFLFILDGIIR